jgi:hypothetical protein
MAVTLSVKLCDGPHKQIQAEAYPVFERPHSYSGNIKLYSAGAPTQDNAEFAAGDQLMCETVVGSGSPTGYLLLTLAPPTELSVGTYRRPGQSVYDVTIPFGATYDPNRGIDDCSNPRVYNYRVTNGHPFDPDFTDADFLVTGTIRVNIKKSEPPTATTSLVTICGITVS